MTSKFTNLPWPTPTRTGSSAPAQEAPDAQPPAAAGAEPVPGHPDTPSATS